MRHPFPDTAQGKHRPTQGAHTQWADLLALHQRVRSMRLHQPVQTVAAGTRLTLLKGRGIDFAEVRAYQPGDDTRSIDWRVTARTGKAHTKVFQEEKQRAAFICVDQGSSMYFGSQHCLKSVYAAHLAAALAWMLHQHGDYVGGLVFADQEQRHIPCRSGRRNILRLLEGIHQLNQHIRPDASMTEPSHTMLEQLSQQVTHNMLVYIISDFVDFDVQTLVYLRYLAKKNRLTLFCVYDPLEADIPVHNMLCFRKGTARNQLYINPRTRDRYRQYWSQRCQHIQQQARHVGISVHYVQQKDDVLSHLHL